MHTLLALLLLLAAPSKPPPFLSPVEIARRLEAMKVAVKVVPLKVVPQEELARELWPEQTPPMERPYPVGDGKGGRTLQSYPCDPKALALVARADPLLDSKQYTEAAALNRQAVSLDPKCYLAWSRLGDAAFFNNDLATALKHYDEAKRLNPDDARTYFYRGNALIRLKRLPEARDSYLTVLSLRPRFPAVVKALKARGAELAVKVNDELFAPRAIARKDGEGVTLHGDATSKPWLSWATCKALWLVDAAHRKELTASEARAFSNVEEIECLASLMSTYLTLRDARELTPDPAMDRIEQIAQAGFLNELVLYEMGTRVSPDAVLVNPTAASRMRAVVERYVAVDTRK